jgi:hypothetical protein
MPGYSTVFDGIIFVESMEPDSRILGKIACDLSFKFGAQLKNLNDVKTDLAAKARGMGANAVLDFKYGQKSRWLAIDDVAYFGSGAAAVLPAYKYSEIINKISSR